MIQWTSLPKEVRFWILSFVRNNGRGLFVLLWGPPMFPEFDDRRCALCGFSLDMASARFTGTVFWNGTHGREYRKRLCSAGCQDYDGMFGHYNNLTDMSDFIRALVVPRHRRVTGKDRKR